MRQLLQIELNEFDPEFLRRSAEELGLTTLLEVLGWQHSHTDTDDETEHQGLDPWVQWVNVHTGQPSAAHGVKRLGDTRGQTREQSWHRVADAGGTFAVWGAMNAPLHGTESCAAFMPDPWCYGERAHPESLNDLLALPRYMSRNYLDASWRGKLGGFARFLRYYAHPGRWGRLLAFSRFAVPSLFRYGAGVHTLTTLLDYLSALEFAAVRERERPTYSVIFLNHIAHLQHQFWQGRSHIHPQMRLGLETCERALARILATRGDGEAVLVLNGLRQGNVEGEGQCVYRQLNPQRFFVWCLSGAQFTLHQNMTNDATLVFATRGELLEAKARLESLRMDGAPLLYVEDLGGSRLFAQLDVHHRVDDDAAIAGGGLHAPFADHFALICERTGAHLQEGDVFADGIEVPARLGNHEVADLAVAYVTEARTASETFRAAAPLAAA